MKFAYIFVYISFTLVPLLTVEGKFRKFIGPSKLSPGFVLTFYGRCFPAFCPLEAFYDVPEETVGEL